MSDRGSRPAEVVIPLAPKLTARSDPSDPLDKAGYLILDMVRQAAVNAQASYQQAAEMSRKLSAQLRGAEDRIRELEAIVRQHEERADRAERWLHHVSVEIEQKFFGREDSRPSQPPSPQAALRNQKQ
jgi:DNA repair ATPase RecN